MHIDAHIHIVGNGRSGSGCWLRVSGFWHRPLAAYMMRHIGLPGLALDAPDFDERYVAHVARLVRESSCHRAIILAQEEVYSDDGKRVEGAGSFYVPNDYVLRLAREHPEFIPAVSIHPARPDAIEELERCIAGGAAVLKLLPNCHNVHCNDQRFRRFWERLAEARIPLLAHTGGEHTVPVIKPEYSDPRVLTQPLECGVTVIAAHAATKSGFGDPEYFHVFAEMLSKFPNLYGDTGAWNVPLRGRHVGKCRTGLLAERLVHGSDFPVPVHGLWARLRGFISGDDYRRCKAIPNVLERDYQLKAAMGFKSEYFTRVGSLLPA